MIKSGLIFSIKIYQVTFPLIRSIFPLSLCCYFPLSCSEYMLESIETFGVISGCWKGLKRVLSCHPFFPKSAKTLPFPPLPKGG